MRRFPEILVIMAILCVACSGPARYPGSTQRLRPIPQKEAKKLIRGALSHIGEPYSFGGTDKSGWDCSGFVGQMYTRYLGISVPRSTMKIYQSSFFVKNQISRMGDLVFFKIDSSKPSHVGIYIGKSKFIHSSSSNGVIVSSLNEKYYRESFIGFRRVNYFFLAKSD